MDTLCPTLSAMSAAPSPKHPLHGRHFADVTSMKSAVAEFFAKQGRGFSSIGGCSKQKKWGFSGKKGGCAAEIRATLQSSKQWKISFVVAEHSNCSGGKAKGKAASLASFASQAINNGPDMKATEIKRSFEVMSGLQVSQRTVTRARGTAVLARRPAAAGTIQQAPGYCAELVEDSPGSVATVEVRTIKYTSVVGLKGFLLVYALFVCISPLSWFYVLQTCVYGNTHVVCLDPLCTISCHIPLLLL